MKPDNPKPNLALLDSILLGVLIVAMCSQINIGDIGQDTTAEGYVTKQLKIALPDIALFLNFLWFAVRTSLLRSWKKLWWPPFPCWALVFALILAGLHSRPLVQAVAENVAETEAPRQIVRALITQESKEAIAETIQFTLYFAVAPLLFVNLIHDRRGGVLLSRRRLALTTFLWALVASLVFAFIRRTESGFQGLFGSPYALSAFLAIAVALVAAQLSELDYKKLRGPIVIIALVMVLSLAAISSLWAVVALLLGTAVGIFLTGNRSRAFTVTALTALIGVLLWSVLPAPLLRTDSMRISSAQEKVKKQFIEWYVASTRLADSRESGFSTGVGPGNYQFNIGSYYARLPNEEKMPPDSNNLYLVQAVNIGVLGLGALLWIVLYFGNIAVDARRRFPNDWLAAGVLGALAAWVFVNLFHATIVRGTGIVFAFILSLAVIAAHYDEEPREESGDTLGDEEKRNFLLGSLS